MLSIEEIRSNYPAPLKGSLFAQNMIKEYLQTLVLARISNDIPAGNRTFIGGTSLRFCHGLDRFSEDLDFDYTGRDKEILREPFSDIVKKIALEGITCIIEHNFKDTDNYCKIVFPDIAKRYNFTDQRKKLWIKIDIQQNRTDYTRETFFINRFGYYYPVKLPEKNILFSMKAVALVSRMKARDMYDFSFISNKAKLDFRYIQNELMLRGYKINTPGDLKELIVNKEKETNIKEKEHEISLFLTQKENKSRVTTFFEYLRKLDFRVITGQSS